MNINSILPMPTPVPVPLPRPHAPNVHVVSSTRGWAVALEGADYYYSFAPTQLEAIAEGMRIARTSASLLIIHGRNGRFREVLNYRR